MNNFDLGYACKWIFGSLAIVGATYITKNANCLWAFFFLAVTE